MAFISKNSVCASVAQNILAELNKITKYARFQLNPELITIDYDIFDTVKLTAVLANKNVDENLKIYSIETEVSGDNETVTLELANFTRGVWASLVLPGASSQGNADLVSFSATNTQALEQIGSSGGSSVIQEEQSDSAAASVTTTESLIHTFTPLIIDKIAGVFLMMSVRIIPEKIGSEDGLLDIRISDGTNFYPSGGKVLRLAYNPHIDVPTYNTSIIFIPVELSGKTLSVRAKVASGKSRVTLRVYLESIDEHLH